MKKFKHLFALLCLLVNLPAFATIWDVSVENFQFVPQNLNILQGDTVRWTNNAGFHNIHHLCDPPLFGNDIQESFVYSFAFTAAGSYIYNCEVHPEVMIGFITVQRVPQSFTINTASGPFRWVPNTLTITRGDTVTFRNPSLGLHSAHNTNSPVRFDNTPSSSNWTLIWRTDTITPGNYNYVCEIHGSMTGVITVNAIPSLAAPANLVILSEAESDIILAWNTVPTAHCYDIYKSLDPTQPVFTDYVGTVMNDTTFTHFGAVTPNLKYFYQVRARQ